MAGLGAALEAALDIEPGVELVPGAVPGPPVPKPPLPGPGPPGWPGPGGWALGVQGKNPPWPFG
jgi:hypothetical protein